MIVFNDRSFKGDGFENTMGRHVRILFAVLLTRNEETTFSPKKKTSFNVHHFSVENPELMKL